MVEKQRDKKKKKKWKGGTNKCDKN